MARRPAGQAPGHDRCAGAQAIEGVDPGQIARLDVTAEGLGTQGHNVPHDEAEKAVQLLPVGQVTARIVSDDPKALAGWTVVASSHPGDASASPRATNASRGQSDESGRVALGPLAVGQIAFRVEPPVGSPFLLLPGAAAPAALRGRETVEVRISVSKGVKVEGSVVEHGSARPAAGVKVNLYVLSPYRRNVDVVTDAEGRFSLYVLPCKLRVSLTWFDLPDRYFHAARRPLGRSRYRRGRRRAEACAAGGLACRRDQGDGGRRDGQARRKGPGRRLVHRTAVRRADDPGQYPDG